MSLLTRIAEPIRNYRANQILKHIHFFLESGESMLSVGDGDGYVSLRIQEKTGVEIQGLDILAYPKYRVPGIPLRLYDGNEPIPFPDDSFDVCIGVFVLHHCPNVGSILKEMMRVSRKKLIIIEDVFNNRLERFFLKFFDLLENRTFSAQMPIPFNFRKLDDWKELFKNLDLHLVHTSQFHALPLPVRNQSFCMYLES
ncbi:MAG: class I SAM-dependent methyltransferase [Candidatus Heimdallarchaeota archaeon]